MTTFRFTPDAEQARALDARMRLSLAGSLEHIAERIEGQIEFDEPALSRVVARMRTGARFPASTFGLYSQAVVAIMSGDHEQARELLALLAREEPLAGPWRALSLDDPVHATHAKLYCRLMGGDDGSGFLIAGAPPALSSSFRERLLRSRALLSRAIPELGAEFDALVSDVLLVTGDEKAKYQFDGGSAYMLWGALFLNATSHPDEVSMIEVMAHESAHLLLYACASDEALVDNTDDELYPSPLRTDLRPMDGIYHATFVSARMHWAMARLLESGLLDAAGEAKARAARDSDSVNFRAGHAVVAAHGRLTATGRHAMGEALAYMDSAAR